VEPTLWFVIVFLVLLKIPLLYLCYIVWWAVKDPPAPEEGLGGSSGGVGSGGGPDAGSWWKRRARNRPARRGPHGSPARRPATAQAQARSRTDR
jgi:hypothetical protein